MKTFDDITFIQRPDSFKWGGVLRLRNYTLSVVAGQYTYSQPREYLMNIEDYSKFEVAVIKERNFVTQEIFPNESDDVLAYQSREEINDIIKTVTEYEKKRPS